VADLLTFLVGRQLNFAHLDPIPGRQEQAITLAKEHLQLLEDLPATDDRKIRARILLLDSLNQNNGAKEAKRLVDRWREEDRKAFLREDDALVALYESRRAASLVGMGEAEKACELFETRDVLARVDKAFPHSWYSNVAKANFVVALDKAGRPSEQARRELGESLRHSLAHRILGHSTAYAISTVFGDRHKHLHDQMVELFLQSFSGHIEFEGFLAEIERSRKRNETGIDEGVAFFCPFIAPELANSLGMANADFSLPEVGNLTRRAAEYCKALPPDFLHYSHRVHAYQEYARYLAVCGRYAEAKEWVDLTVSEYPIDSVWQAERRLGSYLVELGEYEKASILLRRSLVAADQWYGPSGPPAIDILHSLVRLNRLRGNLEEARAWHEKRIERQKRSSFERRFLAVTYLQFGKLGEADSTLREAQGLDPNDFFTGWRQGQALLLRGDHDGAIRRAEEAHTVASKVEQSRKKAFKAAMRRKSARAGEARRRAALARIAMRGADRVHAMALFARGKPGDIEAALRHFKFAAAGKDRVDGDGFWSDYGAALVASGDVDGARAVLENLTTRRSGDPLAWHARARFLATTGGLTEEDRKQAVECARKANDLCKSGRAFVLATLAEAHFRAGDAMSASETATKVKKLMAGRDAQWLSAKQAEARFARYR
jgi:tetratricopeptide (TPR) repeat protein